MITSKLKGYYVKEIENDNHINQCINPLVRSKSASRVKGPVTDRHATYTRFVCSRSSNLWKTRLTFFKDKRRHIWHKFKINVVIELNMLRENEAFGAVSSFTKTQH